MWGEPQNLGNGYSYVRNNPSTYLDPFGLLTGKGTLDVGKMELKDKLRSIKEFIGDLDRRVRGFRHYRNQPIDTDAERSERRGHYKQLKERCEHLHRLYRAAIDHLRRQCASDREFYQIFADLLRLMDDCKDTFKRSRRPRWAEEPVPEPVPKPAPDPLYVPVPLPLPRPLPVPRPGSTLEVVEKATFWATLGLFVYWTISVGSRIIPLQNLVPIP